MWCLRTFAGLRGISNFSFSFSRSFSFSLSLSFSCSRRSRSRSRSFSRSLSRSALSACSWVWMLADDIIGAVPERSPPPLRSCSFWAAQDCEPPLDDGRAVREPRVPGTAGSRAPPDERICRAVMEPEAPPPASLLLAAWLAACSSSCCCCFDGAKGCGSLPTCSCGAQFEVVELAAKPPPFPAPTVMLEENVAPSRLPCALLGTGPWSSALPKWVEALSGARPALRFIRGISPPLVLGFDGAPNEGSVSFFDQSIPPLACRDQGR
mmetsp:Transcript_52263/g.122049  ORF Transcript_52263/g.122049 Transcript_52263/m.122049 type:complete len:266 (+) Transcript_52263:1611-2408(+)